MQAQLGVSSAHGVSHGAGRGRSHRGPFPYLPLPQVPMAECSILTREQVRWPWTWTKTLSWAWSWAVTCA